MSKPLKFRVRGPFTRIEFDGIAGWNKSPLSTSGARFVLADEYHTDIYELEREVSRLKFDLQMAEHRALMAELDLAAEKKKFNTAEFDRTPRPPRKLASEVVDELADRLRR